MTLVSIPKSKPQPDVVAYAPQELHLFKAFTRATFAADYGVEAPPYDPGRKRKDWFDSTVDISDPGAIAVYRTLGRDATGAWKLRQLAIPVGEAGTINLEGGTGYPPYFPKPTRATRGGSTINPVYLSLESEARLLNIELGGDGVVDDGASAVLSVWYPADEPRRSWALIWKRYPKNVGGLLLSRHQYGIGRPGHWNLAGDDPMWVPAPLPPTGENDTRPWREMPYRELLPNEKFQAVLGGMGVQVVRTDKVSAETGGLAEVLALLREILVVVKK